MAKQLTLGNVFMTTGVRATVNEEAVLNGLRRHRAGDRGDVPNDQMGEEERTLKGWGAVYSRYKTETGAAFYVFTERRHPRSRRYTMVLLGEELECHIEATRYSAMPLSVHDITVPPTW